MKTCRVPSGTLTDAVASLATPLLSKCTSPAIWRRRSWQRQDPFVTDASRLVAALDAVPGVCANRVSTYLRNLVETDNCGPLACAPNAVFPFLLGREGWMEAQRNGKGEADPRGLTDAPNHLLREPLGLPTAYQTPRSMRALTFPSLAKGCTRALDQVAQAVHWLAEVRAFGAEMMADKAGEYVYDSGADSPLQTWTHADLQKWIEFAHVNVEGLERRTNDLWPWLLACHYLPDDPLCDGIFPYFLHLHDAQLLDGHALDVFFGGADETAGDERQLVFGPEARGVLCEVEGVMLKDSERFPPCVEGLHQRSVDVWRLETSVDQYPGPTSHWRAFYHAVAWMNGKSPGGTLHPVPLCPMEAPRMNCWIGP